MRVGWPYRRHGHNGCQGIPHLWLCKVQGLLSALSQQKKPDASTQLPPDTENHTSESACGACNSKGLRKKSRLTNIDFPWFHKVDKTETFWTQPKESCKFLKMFFSFSCSEWFLRCKTMIFIATNCCFVCISWINMKANNQKSKKKKPC